MKNLLFAATAALLLCAQPIFAQPRQVAEGPLAAEASPPLWQIGKADHRSTEFALSQGDYGLFMERFGKPENAFYIGLSSAQTDWPSVLPGPLDEWATGGKTAEDGKKDPMNTLPIGFVLASVPGRGSCELVIDVGDADSTQPPTLRINVNGRNFDRQLAPGAGNNPPTGGLGKEQSLRVEFPTSLLRKGYNEISLRSIDGKWLSFDALALQAPTGTKLTPVANTIIRSASAANHAVSADKKTPATVRVEVFHTGAPAKLEVKIGERGTLGFPLQGGVQTFEVPAPVSQRGKPTPVRLGVAGKALSDTKLSLSASRPATPADYVNVFSGTGHGSRWMIAPGPWMPFGMVKIAPDNQPQGWCDGYDYAVEHIDCFSHIHEWTMAGLGMMPTTGPLRTHPGLDGTGYSSRIDKATEHAGIGFYQVTLADTNIKVELAATTRATLQKYTFPASKEARVMFDFLLPSEYQMHVLGATVRRTGPSTIEGVIQTDFPDVYYNGDQRYDLHFVTEFNRPFDSMGGWEGETVMNDRRELKFAGDCGAFANFKTSAGEVVMARTGISLVSTANARLNLGKELSTPFGWDFAAVVANSRAVWNEQFSHADIQTPDVREKSRFYTNFYRAISGRNTMSDVNGEWMDPNEKLQKLSDPDGAMLGCDAFWTTFWNLNQMMNLVAPEWSARWTNSQLALYDRCGWLSKGCPGLEYISVMVAEHEIALLIAAHQAGVKGIDADKILEAAVKMQTTLPEPFPGGGWVGNENLENYLKHGYVAADGGTVGRGTKVEWERASTSNTFEYAYDDWCVAQMAKSLGRTEVAEKFMKRSQNWRNSFDLETGFARPRLANGDWVSPFDSNSDHGFTEASAWQYSWFVPQDVPGLVKAMGRDRFLSRLNEGFVGSEAAHFNSAAINHGNQPMMHAGWLFNWAGAPEQTQKWTRAILDGFYGYNPSDAYLGDDDQGQSSAWFVMASMGLFQTDGGCRTDPIYELSSPLYPKTSLHLSKKHYGGKTFVIEAHGVSRENRYIQSAKLNGKPLNQWWIFQRDVVKGGKLEYEMGPKPNPNWAKNCPLPGSSLSK